MAIGTATIGLSGNKPTKTISHSIEAALVGGLFHFKPTNDVAYWHKADNRAAPEFVIY